MITHERIALDSLPHASRLEDPISTFEMIKDALISERLERLVKQNMYGLEYLALVDQKLLCHSLCVPGASAAALGIARTRPRNILAHEIDRATSPHSPGPLTFRHIFWPPISGTSRLVQGSITLGPDPGRPDADLGTMDPF